MSDKEAGRRLALTGAGAKQSSLERREAAAAAAALRPERGAKGTRPGPRASESRLLQFSIAGIVCFFIAAVLGGGSWYLFGTHERAAPERAAPVTQTTPQPAATPVPQPSIVALAPAGELSVPGGEVALGGEGSDLPLRREFVKPFAVAETEVTNEQYREFVKATGRKAPEHWKAGEFPPGAANEPVTNVSWQDAADYCRWLSEKLGANVRLPSEAEWELAAKGREGFKHPWGNDWDDHASDSLETGGRVRAVKSFPEGKSPFGAYDMAGNVWEWVSDEARDGENNLKRNRDGVALRIIKGGSANEKRAFITTSARYEVPSDFKGSKWIGFRYVVERGGEASSTATGGGK
ncbi:MAG TPA: SUMF1/EgtB/PvdO family nonheme iron enzyme [Pyrinomonadaceae bacterium]|nr:SUMF1/EgtB/PvdO family nonheme iron enzyme [Pyrinomonadaceae bacterium]